MNFAKHRVTEEKMLSELMDYCLKIIRHKRKTNEDFLNMYCCISTRTHGVEIIYKLPNRTEQMLMAIRYDERNDFYYVIETLEIGKRKLENRIILKDREDFYAVFDHKYEKAYMETHLERHMNR